jgi:hypothetical protein
LDSRIDLFALVAPAVGWPKERTFFCPLNASHEVAGVYQAFLHRQKRSMDGM